jgi:hypothetical protein
MRKLQVWPPEWFLYKGRRVIEVSSWYYSPLWGQVLLVITSLLFFWLVLGQDVQPVWITVVLGLTCGFLFACAWAIRFPYRSLVIHNGQLDSAYMLLHLVLEYTVIYLILSGLVFFHMVLLLLGSLIFHYLDIRYYRYHWKHLQRRSDGRKATLKRAAAEPTLATVIHQADSASPYTAVEVHPNPFYKPLICYGCWLLTIALIVIVKWSGSFLSREIWMAVGSVTYMLGGFLITIAGLFGSKNISLHSLVNTRLNPYVFVTALCVFIVCFFMNYLLYYELSIYLIIYLSFITTVFNYITNVVLISRLQRRWKKQYDLDPFRRTHD